MWVECDQPFKGVVDHGGAQQTVFLHFAAAYAKLLGRVDRVPDRAAARGQQQVLSAQIVRIGTAAHAAEDYLFTLRDRAGHNAVDLFVGVFLQIVWRQINADLFGGIFNAKDHVNRTDDAGGRLSIAFL